MKIIVVNYRLLASDIASEWSRRGVEVALIDPTDLNLNSIREIKRRNYRFIFGMNYSPDLSKACMETGLPYVSWTIDPIESRRWPKENRSTDLIYAFRRKWCEAWSRSTGTTVRFLPIAATSNRRDPMTRSTVEESEPFALWVGNSCAHDWHRHSSEVRSWYADVQEPLDAWIASRVGTDDHFGSSMDPSFITEEIADLVLAAPPGWRALVEDLGAFRGRMSMLERLEDMNVEFWGDAYLRRFGQRYKGFAEHGDCLTNLYRRASVTLDIPRWYQSDIITMRVFDSMASGGVILTYDNSDVRELFCPEVHLDTYRSQDEFVAKSNRLLRDRQRTRNLRRSGMAWVNRFHRIEHRVDEIERDVRDRGWWPAETGQGYSLLSPAASGATKSGGASTPVPKKNSSICLLSTS